MARLAASEYGADWVFNNDADQFWWPITGTIKDGVDQIPEEYGGAGPTPRRVRGAPGGPRFLRRPPRRARSPFEPATEGRPSRSRRGGAEQHARGGVRRGRGPLRGAAPPGASGAPRGSLRRRRTRTRGAQFGAEEMRLAWVPTHPLRIFQSSGDPSRRGCKRTEIFLNSLWFRDTGRFRRPPYQQGRLDEIYNAPGPGKTRPSTTGSESYSSCATTAWRGLLPALPGSAFRHAAGVSGSRARSRMLERERAEVELDSLRKVART